MQNQLCRVCEEPAAGFHFGAFTCEGCKSFFGRTCNNQSVISECKNNYRCVVDKKNRTACKACRLRKCLMMGMSKSGSRYGRRSNWFKIHCLMQQNMNGGSSTNSGPSKSSPSSSSTSSLSPNHPVMWPSPTKTELKLEEPPMIKERSPSHSPELPPTMVPRTSVTSSFSPSHLTAFSPTTPTSKPEPASTGVSPFLPSLYSGFPSPLSLMSGVSGFPGIPFHKQALLSPLLAQSHLWQLASRHPLLGGGLRPDVDLLAEHKALLEKFAATSAALREKSVSPPTSSKSPEPLQQGPMDLSSRKSDDGNDENDSTTSAKEDMNRNLVLEEKVLDLCRK